MMGVELNLKPQVEAYVGALVQRGATNLSVDLDKIEPNKRGYQLAFNMLELSLRDETIKLRSVEAMRISTCALAKRDLDFVRRRYPEQVPITIKGFRDEMRLFREHFPEDRYPSLYLDDIVKDYDVELILE